MSASLPVGDGQVKADEIRKQTLLWYGSDWDRIEEAARKLSEQTKAVISVPNFIRGAALARADELLSDTVVPAA